MIELWSPPATLLVADLALHQPRLTLHACACPQKNKDHIGSLSTIGYGPPGPGNVSAAQFNAELKAMGIDTYFLWGGNWNSFWTKEAINNTVQYVFKQLEATGEVGVDLDFEHPETWGPDFADPLNKSFAAELTSKYSDFLRTLSAALHAKGFKMSECVGSYPTRDGGIAVYYDPAVRDHEDALLSPISFLYARSRGADHPGSGRNERCRPRDEL